MEYLQKAGAVLKELTGMALSVLALGVVLQVLFGSNVAFLPGDVVGNVVGVTKSLGSEGLSRPCCIVGFSSPVQQEITIN